jgi:hypothetical protein
MAGRTSERRREAYVSPFVDFAALAVLTAAAAAALTVVLY